MQSKFILIAGGTGLIGKRLADYLFEKGYNIGVLTRNPIASNHYYWNPDKSEIDTSVLEKVTHLVNLTGESIASQRWSVKRKEVILDSRIKPIAFLYSHVSQMTRLQHFISASGVTCFDVTKQNKIFVESDLFGVDFLSKVVQQWEKEADLFQSHCLVSKVRISPVLDSKGGIIHTMKKPILLGLGSSLGSGNQWMPWIHQKDLSALFYHIIIQQLEGVFHAVASNHTNKEFTLSLAKVLNRKIMLPNLPEPIAKILFGEMATLLLDGVQISNSKIIDSGFVFQFDDLESALYQVVG